MSRRRKSVLGSIISSSLVITGITISDYRNYKKEPGPTSFNDKTVLLIERDLNTQLSQFKAISDAKIKIGFSGKIDDSSGVIGGDLTYDDNLTATKININFITVQVIEENNKWMLEKSLYDLIDPKPSWNNDQPLINPTSFI